jgi:uncharacterized protein (DUF1697 family)
MWVALLRAVNLGSHNKVPMARLREAMAADGYGAVRTLIASGNVVFERARPSAASLERLIADEFGVATTVILRSASQVRTLAAANPFDGESYVAFTAATPPRSHGLDAVLIGRDFVFPRSDAVTGAVIEKALGIEVTVRNRRTVEKLAHLVQA